ncbi:steroid delta-isomerase [Mycolicibacterium moriokaense]|nr:steroid delta-isomerase [Mycolicibacterium moriokaense]
MAALFADDATLEDPVGCGTVHVGRQAITEFYRAMDGAELSTELLEIRVGGLEAVFSFVITMGSGDARVTVRPMEVMIFNRHGEIVSMKAYWSRADVTEG